MGRSLPANANAMKDGEIARFACELKGKCGYVPYFVGYAAKLVK